MTSTVGYVLVNVFQVPFVHDLDCERLQMKFMISYILSSTKSGATQGENASLSLKGVVTTNNLEVKLVPQILLGHIASIETSAFNARGTLPHQDLSALSLC